MTQSLIALPKLRFSGFNDQIKVTELGKVTKWASGGTPPKDNPLYWGGEIPWISASSMYGSDFSKSTRTLTPEGVSQGSRIAEKGSILLLVRGSMLFNAVPVGTVSQDVAFNQDVKAITSNDLDSKYLLYFFQASQHTLLSKVVGTGIGAGKLDLDGLLKLSLKVPARAEQEKIADFLTMIDKRITVSENKLLLLKQYKKSVMQKIFTLQIGFKDETGNPYAEWEEVKAGEVFSSISNKQHSGDLPILSVTQDEGVVPRKSLGRKIDSSDAGVKNYKIIEPKDFVISLRSFQSGVEMSAIRGISSPAYTVIRGNSRIAPEMFKYYFKREAFISQLNATVIGIRDGKQISYGPFSSLKLPLPSIAEQQKIAGFISALNDKIMLEESKLARAKQFKKALLQRMFI